MWDFVKKQEDDCSRFRDSLEELASGGASREMLEHSAACEDCAAAAEELLESRELLRALPRESSPSMAWFPPRVMASCCPPLPLQQRLSAETLPFGRVASIRPLHRGARGKQQKKRTRTSKNRATAPKHPRPQERKDQ